MKATYPRWPIFGQDQIAAVAEVLSSGQVNYWSGTEGKNFEQEFGDFCGCRYAVAVANGTLALELALYSVGVCSGDEVIVTSRSFIASVSCIVMRGARPVLVDVDHESQNITPESIRKAITKKTKAIIVVHLAGWPCDMDSIVELAEQHELRVIEDCAQAHGAKYKGRPVGSFGHVSAFSFCEDKIITTGGEGGMLTTNDNDVWERAWSYKDHGKSYDLVFNHTHPPGYRWLHETFGTNYRLTEMQSAIGRLALRKLPMWVKSRRENANVFNEFFSRYSCFRVTRPKEKYYHSYYKYYVFVRPDKLNSNWDRDRIMNAISERGVPCFNTYAGEVYLDEAFVKAGLRPSNRFHNAKLLGETCLQFLVHPSLSRGDIENMCYHISKVVDKVSS